MMNALSAICLVLLLTSCSKAPSQVPETVVLLPPESTFTPCKRPMLQGNTWGDAVSYTLALKSALQICAGQIVTLNVWRESLSQVR
ncbi:Rz1-like lysis system protein LysC [Serratia fonticola]|uniref:Rz1-like lysis system protein LysC n=1 Tax=Serratia fonticola TaxID=47917 RepID=UPI003F6385E0